MKEKKDHRTLLIVGETIDGRLSPASRRLGRQARKLAGLFESQAVGILTGHRIHDAARAWSDSAGISVIVMDSEQLRYPHPPLTVAGLLKLADEFSPVAVCFPHSLRACQTAASLAWRLEAPCISAVESVCRQNAGITLKRSIHGGKFCETVSVADMPLAMTSLPGMSIDGPIPAPPEHSQSVETRCLQDVGNAFIPRSITHRATTDQALEKVQVIVSAGRGLGGPEHTGLLEKVAGTFKSAAVGGSRGACDLGWLPHSRQIGETGRTVAPALYLACGISGAPQHLAGMRESQTIVAINSDPQAAMLKVAHYAVVEDLHAFLPMLLKRYHEQTAKGETQ